MILQHHCQAIIKTPIYRGYLSYDLVTLLPVNIQRDTSFPTFEAKLKRLHIKSEPIPKEQANEFIPHVGQIVTSRLSITLLCNYTF